MRVTALENEADRNARKKHTRSVRGEERRGRRNETVRRWNSMRQQDSEQRQSRRSGYLPSFEEREREAEEYTSMDHYCGPSVYRDPPATREYSQYLASNASYMEGNHGNQYHGAPLQGPFRTPQHQQLYPLERFPTPISRHHDSIPAEPYFTHASSIRQGPYHLFQNPPPATPPISPYHHPDIYNDIHRDRLPRLPFDDMSDIPMTRMTRLKPSYKAFARDDGIRSDVGIGLGRISGMAPTRSVSSRRGGTKSDVGVGTRSTPTHSQQPIQPQVPPPPFNPIDEVSATVTTSQRIQSLDTRVTTDTPRSHKNRQTYRSLQNLHHAHLPSHHPRFRILLLYRPFCCKTSDSPTTPTPRLHPLLHRCARHCHVGTRSRERNGKMGPTITATDIDTRKDAHEQRKS